MYKKIAFLLVGMGLWAACRKEQITLSPQPKPLYSVLGSQPGIFDAEGRFVLLRGVNYNVLGDYWQANAAVPTVKNYDADDIKAMAKEGFNCIRLLFSWSALEPEPAYYDQNYINKIKRVIEDAAEYDMYVLLDMHQDAWGKYIATPADDTSCVYPNKGWDGAPLWATYTDGASTCSPTGSREKAPAVYHAWQNFWDNTNGIQDYFVGAWQALVRQTAMYPNVLGYDLVNEPSLGYKTIGDEIAKMSAAYGSWITAIRNAEAQAPAQPRIIFFENAIQWNGQDAVCLPNYGFTDDPNIVFAPHSYFESIQMNYTIEQGFNILNFGRNIFNSPWFIGEWGFFGNPADDTSKLKRFARLEDQYFASSTWWQWAQAPGDPHAISWDGNDYAATSLHLVELDQNAVLTGVRNDLFLNILNRSRPNAIAGYPTSLVSNPDNGYMRLEAEATEAGITELWIPNRFGTPTVSGTNANLLEMNAVEGGYRAKVSVQGAYSVEVSF